MFVVTAVVLYNIYYIVVVWTAVCLTGYSGYSFHELLSASYICHTGLKTV